MSSRVLLINGLIFLILAVALGAFGAHALKSILTEDQLTIWKTANDYHFYHALGLLVLGLWCEKVKQHRLISVAGICLVLGLLLFCGSLYILAFTGITKLGIVTPFGGILFILGWFFWLIAVVKSRR